jgi:hypothetical protein
MSLTVTVNEHIAMLFEASVAVHVTVVTPFWNVAPLAGTHTTEHPEPCGLWPGLGGATLQGGQLSVTTGSANVTTAVQTFGSVLCAIGSGQVIIGGWVSLTVTVKAQLGPAVVEQVTVVTPFWKVEPDSGLQVTVPHIPVVVGAEYVATAVHTPAAASTTTLDGQVIVQGVTVTVNEQLPVLALVSVAVQVTVVVPTPKQFPDAGKQLTVGLGQLSLAVGVV